MKIPQKQRVQVASFTWGDVPTSHLTALLGGVVLILLSLCTAWVAVINSNAISNAKNVAQLMLATATQAESGAKNYSAGASTKLAAAAANGPLLSAALADANNLSSLVLPQLSDANANALASWQVFGGDFREVWKIAAPASELSAAAGGLVENFAQLVKVMETSGRTTGAYAAPFWSVLRLQSYSEAGFGASSVPRFDYDLKVIYQTLANTELKANMAFLDALIQLDKQAAGVPMSSDQLARLVASAAPAKAAAENLYAVASKSSVVVMLFLVAAAMLMGGLVVTGAVLNQVIRDTGRRYIHALQKFRVSEDDRQDLTEKLHSATQGDTNTVVLKNPGSEYADIAEKINFLMSTQAEQLRENYDAMRITTENLGGLLNTADTAQAGINESIGEINAATERLNDSLRHVKLISADAKAAYFAAQTAGERAADANRTTQDSGSRLDALREGLLDTAKGIKRLGERAQEIGVITDEMSALTEQTNVIALNASLEAERAGEAGAGFRLVAREVQSLANKSRNSLEHLAALVTGAQADARSVTEAVEKSNSQISAGANLGSVSQALLSALPPLAQDVAAMTKAINEEGRGTESALLDVSARVKQATTLLKGALKAAEQLRGPMTKAQDCLNQDKA